MLRHFSVILILLICAQLFQCKGSANANSDIAATAHGFFDDAVKAFDIAADGQGEVKVNMDSAKCVFKYRTSSGREEEEEKEAKPLPDPKDLIKTLDGKCFETVSGFWTYTVCLGQHVKQSHGSDEYNLGDYRGIDDETVVQYYQGGTNCPDLPDPDRGRTVDLHFQCHQSDALLGAVEPSTCHYVLTLGTPVVCGHPKFSKAAGPATHFSEGWYLEMFRNDDGETECVVQSSGVSISESVSQQYKPLFTSAKLEIDSAISSHNARELGDSPVDPSKLEAGNNFVKTKDGYRGQLQYMRVSE